METDTIATDFHIGDRVAFWLWGDKFCGHIYGLEEKKALVWAWWKAGLEWIRVDYWRLYQCQFPMDSGNLLEEKFKKGLAKKF